MKFYGMIGFWEFSEEKKPGVFRPRIIERNYYGDILSYNQKFQSRSDFQNEDFQIKNRISILADLYAKERFSSIRYVVLGGTKWKVTNIEVLYPRIILELGGLYNENKTGSS